MEHKSSKLLMQQVSTMSSRRWWISKRSTESSRIFPNVTWNETCYVSKNIRTVIINVITQIGTAIKCDEHTNKTGPWGKCRKLYITTIHIYNPTPRLKLNWSCHEQYVIPILLIEKYFEQELRNCIKWLWCTYRACVNFYLYHL